MGSLLCTRRCVECVCVCVGVCVCVWVCVGVWEGGRERMGGKKWEERRGRGGGKKGGGV